MEADSLPLHVVGREPLAAERQVARRVAAALGAHRVMLPRVGHSPNIEAPDTCLGHLLAHFG